MIPLIETFPLLLTAEEIVEFRESFSNWIRNNFLSKYTFINKFNIQELYLPPTSLPSISADDKDGSIRIEWKENSFKIVFDLLLKLNPLSTSSSSKITLLSKIHRTSLAKRQVFLPIRVMVSSPKIEAHYDVDKNIFKKFEFDFNFLISPFSFLSFHIKNKIIKTFLLRMIPF